MVCRGLYPWFIGKGDRCQIYTRFSDLGLDPNEAFKTKIPKKPVVIKFRDLLALRFTRSLELYFCACPEMSQSWWSWVSNWRLALYLFLTKHTVGTVSPMSVLRACSAFRDLFLTLSHTVAVVVCNWNAKFLSSAQALHSSLIIYLEDLEVFIPYSNREYSNIFGPKHMLFQIYYVSWEKAWPAGERIIWHRAVSPAWLWLQHSLQAKLDRNEF